MLASCSKDDDNYNSIKSRDSDYIATDPIQPTKGYPVVSIYGIFPVAVTYQMLKNDYDDFGYRTGGIYHYQVNTFTCNDNK